MEVMSTSFEEQSSRFIDPILKQRQDKAIEKAQLLQRSVIFKQKMIEEQRALRRPHHEYTFTPQQAIAKFRRPKAVLDEEHYRHDNCRQNSKLPPIPKFTPQTKTPKNVSIGVKTPKKTRINYRDVEEEYSWGPGFGLPPQARHYPNAGYRKIQYIS